MTTTLTLWTADAAGQARPLEGGRVPADLPVLVVAAPTGTPDDARLELVAGERRVEPLRIGQRPGPVVWLVDTTTLRAARRWTAVLTDDDDDTLGTLELMVDGAGPPRVVDLRVHAVVRDGLVPANGAAAEAVQVLVVAADLEAPPSAPLTVRVDDPAGRTWTTPTVPVTLPPGGPPRVAASVQSRPFAEGDWTVSLLHERTLLRRARLRLAPTPLGVRGAAVLALGPQGARPVGPALSRDEAQGRLVVTYSLAGAQAGASVRATLALTYAAGAPLGAWALDVDRGDPDALERVWFPLPAGALAVAASPVTARLVLDGGPEHVQTLEVAPPAPVATFRSDGVVVSAPTDAAPPPPDFGAAGGFFGLVMRRVRRRRKREEPPPSDGDLPF